jgi:hypothetical protein
LLSGLLLYVEVSSLPLLSEAGYGDSYILFDVMRLRTTGSLTSEEREGSWRGIAHIAPVLGEAISAAYRPHCRLMGSVVHMPKRLHSRSEALAKALGRIPCERIR